MSVYFIGDPHFGHKAIAKYRKFVSSPEDNEDQLIAEWKATVRNKDIVYVMGDAAFTYETLLKYKALPGRKILIKGNHDDMVTTAQQMEIFEEIHGMIKYKGMWLTHAPVHPDELRGKNNVHGHVHEHSIMRRTWYGKRVLDKRYLNTCPDVIYHTFGKCILSLDEVKAYFRS